MQSILIADAHNLCREALCDYIRHADNKYDIGSVGDYGDLVTSLETRRPDLILVNTELPGWKPESVTELCARVPEGLKVGLIIPLMHTEAVWDSKVSGVFPKSLSCKAFLGGIGDILEGKTFFPPLKDNGQAFELAGAQRPPQDYNLTTREKQVLGHLVKGASNKDIARALDLQVVTVKLHVRGICRKMKASNRTQAALLAKENGWG